MWHQSGSTTSMEWNQAKNWLKSLNNKGYAGYHDWRFPTLEEAVSLLEEGINNADLFIDPIFSHIQPNSFSGDKYETSNYTWNVFFDDGLASASRTYYAYYVRPVRSVE